MDKIVRTGHGALGHDIDSADCDSIAPLLGPGTQARAAVSAVAVLTHASFQAGRLVIPGLTHVHFDIEPHILSEWKSDPGPVGIQFVQLLHDMQVFAYQCP